MPVIWRFSDTGSSLNVNTLELTNTTVVSMSDVPTGGALHCSWNHYG